MASNSYDAIIVGAGSIGAPAAFSMSRAGLKVLVIDQLSSPGQGSNKRAIGGIRATHSDQAKISLSLRSIEMISQWKDTYGDDIEWVQGGYIFVAYRDEEEQSLKSLLKLQKSLGLSIEWLDAGELLTVAPDLDPDGLRGGTYSPGDGNASPLLLNHACYQHARQSGAEFQFNQAVNGLIIEKGRVAGVSTPTGDYHSPVVVNAAGAWARSFVAMAGLDLPVFPDSHEAAITEPVARFLYPMIVDICPGPGSENIYFYQHATGQIIFCITPQPLIPG